MSKIGADIASGLNAAHHAGIIHRDIKPHNVLLTSDGVAQLTDFGIAHARDMTALTRTGARLGTPHYMSPEQVDGGAVDERSDIYSLGCVMYHMLTGAPPFNAESAMAVVRMHLDATPAPLESRVSGINPGLAHIVKRCMAKNPADRYTTAAELFKDLTGDFDDSVLRSGAQNFQVGDDYEEIQEPLSPKELAHLLTPDIETSPDTEKKCRNCGLSAESNVLNCQRCGYSEWRAAGPSVFADPFTLSGADKLGRKDKTREQAVFTKITLLTLLAISLSLGMAAVLIWSQHEDPVLAGYEDLAEASDNLDLPLVKRLETASGHGETRVDMNPVDANVLGIDVLSFRARFGGIETAITLSTDLEAGDPPPEPVYRQFRADVFAQPDIAAERFIFRFHIPTTWLEQHEIEMPKVRLWTHNRSEWAPLGTFNIAIEDGVATFLGFSPGPGDFAIGALP